MKSSAMAVLAALALAGPQSVLAVRDIGDLPLPQTRRAPDAGVAAAPQPRSGVVTGVRATHPRGMEIEIDGRWWLVLPGRTPVLRNGRPVGEAAIAAGQAVRYAPASPAPGERALDFVQVP